MYILTGSIAIIYILISAALRGMNYVVFVQYIMNYIVLVKLAIQVYNVAITLPNIFSYCK